jgi:hypothetical protein
VRQYAALFFCAVSGTLFGSQPRSTAVKIYELWRKNPDKTKPPIPIIKSEQRSVIDFNMDLLKQGENPTRGLFVKIVRNHV